MTGEEIIVTFKEPWYNDYTRRLYTQLSEQMIREEIERVHKEPIITNTAFDIAVDKAFLELLHDNKDLINITERYKNQWGNRPKHRTVYSISAMIKVTDNKEVKETVLAGLKRNKEKYGKKYCPCSLVRDEDTVCMCKEFREMEEGTCHCQLYVKTKD